MREYGTQGDMSAPEGDARGEPADVRSRAPQVTGFEQFIFDEAEPVITSNAFQRLYDVTFLGILSRRYAGLPGHPLAGTMARKSNLADDGSRADHSLSVAALVARFCDAFSLSANTKRYGIAWGLIHDIATWPLSHTGEAAFSAITGVAHKHLRQMMVVGDPALPSEFHLSVHIRKMGIDPERLVLLFAKNIDKASEDDPEFLRLYSFIHSSITPDTLEGIHRSGAAIGIQVPDPISVLDSFEVKEIDYINGTIVRRRGSKSILDFWRKKHKIYKTYINASRTVAFESRWSYGIKERFGGISVAESLRLNESEIVAKVSERGLSARGSILRYKAPQKYFLDGSLKRKRMLQFDCPIENLNDMLRRKEGNMKVR